MEGKIFVSDRRTIGDFYQISEELGRGHFSVVKKGKQKLDGRDYAVKIIKKSALRPNLIEREISIMKSLKHPNIIPLIDLFEDNTFLYIVLELIHGGELFERIVEHGNFGEQDAANILRQILSAVAYLHKNDIAHRDLKPENVLVCGPDNNLQIVVADFGLSRILNEEENTKYLTYCGSPEYVAPEIIEMQPYSKAVDLWAVGVMSYVLLTGFMPFYSKSPKELFNQIKGVKYNWEDCPDVGHHAKDFVSKLLVKDPKARFSAEQALEHPWLQFGGASKRIYDMDKKKSFRQLIPNNKNKKF